MPKKPLNIDKIDQKILWNLAKNARISFAQLSEKVNLSQTPLMRRVKNLEKSGIISGYSANINYQLLGYEIRAICHVSLKNEDHSQLQTFMTMLNEQEEIEKYYLVTGTFTFILFIMVKNLQEYEKFISTNLLQFSGIKRVETAIILKGHKNKQTIDGL